MMVSLLLFLVRLVDLTARILVLLIVVDVVLSYFTPPYHPVRAFLDRLVLPMLRPLRRVIPPWGGLDFTPIVLILLIEVGAQLINRVLLTLAFGVR